MNDLAGDRRAWQAPYDCHSFDLATLYRQRIGHCRRAVARLYKQSSVFRAEVRGVTPGRILLNRREWLVRKRLNPPSIRSCKENDFFIRLCSSNTACDVRDSLNAPFSDWRNLREFNGGIGEALPGMTAIESNAEHQNQRERCPEQNAVTGP